MAMAICPGRTLFELASRADRQRLARLDAQYGEVRIGIAAKRASAELAPVGQRHGDLLGPVDDVVVGEHQSIGRDDDA